MNRTTFWNGSCAAAIATVLLASGGAAQQWVADASKASIPNRPAEGRVHGARFVVKQVELETSGTASGEKKVTYFFNLLNGKDSFTASKFSITLLTKPGEKLDGKRFTVDAQNVQTPASIKDGNALYPPVQGVMMSWATPKGFPETDLGSKWTMRLEFGQSTGRKIPGKIYVSMRDAQKSYVAGSFTAVLERIQHLDVQTGGFRPKR